jgi:uroporphyrinogen decarboxylase
MESKGRETLLKAVRNETTHRPAWVPFVGCHGVRIIGKSAEAYLHSSELIVQGLREARALYRPDGLPLVFDLQVEAEVLGCNLQWSEEGPPSVISHPLEEGTMLPELPVFNTEKGRYPVILDALRELRRAFEDDVALYGLICGPFTLALHLMGNDIFLKMFDHPDYVTAVLGYCATVGRKSASAYLDHGADVIAVVDPMTSQISPEHFKDFVVPHVDQIFAFIREAGGLSSLFVCGDATRNLETMCRTACDNVSIDENIPLERLRDFTRATKKSFGGNLKLTTALLLGDEDDAKLEAIRCIDVGGRCGFVLAPGCDLPFATPVENLQAVAGMVHDEYAREVAKRTIIAKTVESASVLELPDYENESRVYVDVVTLDSASCAPCQYMMDAVNRAAARLKAPLVVREHRITTREGLGMMRSLRVQHIPSICVDGEVRFSSLIPDQKTLVEVLQRRFEEKKGRRFPSAWSRVASTIFPACRIVSVR